MSFAPPHDTPLLLSRQTQQNNVVAHGKRHWPQVLACNGDFASRLSTGGHSSAVMAACGETLETKGNASRPTEVCEGCKME